MPDKITYDELVSQIAEAGGETKERTDAFLKEMVGIINLGLERDGKVRIAGFGVYELRTMAETQGIDPQTGEPITIPEHTRVAFKPSLSLSRRVNKRYQSRDPLYLDNEPKEQAPAETRRRYSPALIAVLSFVLVALVVVFFLFQNYMTNGSETVSQRTEPEAGQTGIRQSTGTDETAEPDADAGTGIDNKNATTQSHQQAQESAESVLPLEHTVYKGDCLWDLAGEYYGNAFLWPNIYRVNADEVADPDVIYTGAQISVPRLQGSGSVFTARDSADIASGFLTVYHIYNNNGDDRADNYLLVANRFDSGTPTD